MKTLLTAFLLIELSGVVTATEHRLVDGKIQFVVAEVNRQKAYSASEKTKLQDKFNAQASSGTPLDVVNYTPTSAEVNLSTCLVKIECASCFSDYKTNKTLLLQKIAEARQMREKYQDDTSTAEYKDYNDRFQWLLSYYNTLQ